MNSLQAKLLIASRHLLDPNFTHAVVLMVRHDEEGALGLVLNRPSDHTIGEVWTEVLELPTDNPSPIYIGGPCAGQLMALHKNPRCVDLEIADGLYLATQTEYLESLVAQDSTPFRIFSGYSGWAGGQLEDELEVGSWLISDAPEQAIFGDTDELWKSISRRVGEDILFGALGIKAGSHEPELN